MTLWGLCLLVTSRAVVSLQPASPRIYHGEALTLRCEIEGGEDFEWEFLWTVRGHRAPVTARVYRIGFATGADAGTYMCLGKLKTQGGATAWSAAVTLTVSNCKSASHTPAWDSLKVKAAPCACLPAAQPTPVLTRSPSWLGPAGSVTLKCSVQDPYQGWRFYWYKAIPNLDIGFYNMEPLPGSSNGTGQPYLIVHGQTQTAGYFCKAGRGNPLWLTDNSQIKFVWSGGEPCVDVAPNFCSGPRPFFTR